MGMKLRITHNDIMAMVNEAINRLDYRSVLMEITSQDAYARFYQGKIPEKAYNKLMLGAEQMTPLHKLAADHVVPLYASKQTRPATKLINTVSKFWSTASNESRQYAIKVCKDDGELLKKNINIFQNTLEELAGMKSHSEGSYIERGLEVLYEDEKLRVTCTKSYSSSCRHYGKSHWCTASDIFGEYDGSQMFKRYTVIDKSILVQFVNKEYPESDTTFQAQIRANGRFGNICDWSDYAITERQATKILEKMGESLTDICQKYIIPNLKRLYTETAEIYKDEEVYYRRKKAEKTKKFIKNVATALNSNDCTEFAKYLLSKDSRWAELSEDASWRGYTVSVSNDIKFVSVEYEGKSQAERDFFEAYFDDEEYYSEEYGVITNNVIIVFDRSGDIIGRYPGYISIHNNHFVLVTDRYDDELYNCTVKYIINSKTGQVMFTNVVPMNCDDCDSYLYDLGDEQLNKIFNGKYRDGEWFVFGDTRRKHAFAMSQETGETIQIPYLEAWF